MTLNEAKLTAMVEAVELWFSKTFEDGEALQWPPEYHKQLRHELTMFCMEMTDEEIQQERDLYFLYEDSKNRPLDILKAYRMGIYTGAKFYRDR